MLKDARDIAAVIYYGSELYRLRESYLERFLAGEKLPANFFPQGEQAAMNAIKKMHYSVEARQLCMPGKEKSVTDEQDFEGRSTQLAEYASLETHRLLVAIPFVGQGEFRDE